MITQGVYRHYKGEYYFVIGIAQHTEEDTRLVLYVPLTGNEGRAGLQLRARPLNGVKGFRTPQRVFSPSDPATGTEVERFTYIGEEMPGAKGSVVG